MIIKINRSQLFEHILFAKENEWHVEQNDKDIPSGKLSLSLKVGKRRKLIKGIMTVFPDSCRSDQYGSELYYRYVFKPNNPDRLRKLIAKYN